MIYNIKLYLLLSNVHIINNTNVKLKLLLHTG
jgi:hypothetical protein